MYKFARGVTGNVDDRNVRALIASSDRLVAASAERSATPLGGSRSGGAGLGEFAWDRCLDPLEQIGDLAVGCERQRLTARLLTL
jgi:hypothetical protein